MINYAPIGLGEPDDASKQSLFRPPEIHPINDIRVKQLPPKKPSVHNPLPRPKFRTSIELTPQAMVIIHEIQQAYRLQSGKSLPLWRAICELIEHKGKNFRVPRL